jgi:hypothetical protein
MYERKNLLDQGRRIVIIKIDLFPGFVGDGIS